MASTGQSAADLTHESDTLTHGWESYPMNSSWACDEDLDVYHGILRDNTERLFRHDRMRLELRVVPNISRETGSYHSFQEAVEVTNELEFDRAFPNYLALSGDHIISFYQQHTWAPFSVTQAIFLKLLTVHSVHPNFLDVLNEFGHRKHQCEEELPEGCSFRVEPSQDGPSVPKTYYEVCYSLMYVERSGRDTHPWSMRRMGVYQRYSFDSGVSVWILLQPTPGSKQIIAAMKPKSGLLLLQHVLLCASKTRNWRYYLKELQKKVWEMGQNVRFATSSIRGSTQSDFEVAFSDVQRLQYLQEAIQDVIMTMKTNIEVLNGLKSLSESLETHKLHLAQQDSAFIKDRIHSCISRFLAYQTFAEDLLDRASRISDLTQNLLGFRHDTKISQNSTNLAQLAEVSKKDSASIVLLTKAAGRDSRTMKLIAIITMVYLPGNFMATVFSTSFVNLASPDSSLENAEQLRRVAVAREAGAYVAATVGLTLLTLALAYLWNKEQEKREESEHKKASDQGYLA